MILWGRWAAALLTGIFLMALLFSAGSPGAGIVGGILNFTWVLSEKIPSSLGRFLPPLVLVINTVLSAYGAFAGGTGTWAVLAAGGSLFSWNASLFLRRWPQPSLQVQYRYLRRMGGILTAGLGAGISALALQGDFSLDFLGAFFFLLIGSVLFLRLISVPFQKAQGWERYAELEPKKDLRDHLGDYGRRARTSTANDSPR